MNTIVLRAGRAEDAETIYAMLRALARGLGAEQAFTSTIEDVRRDGFGPAPYYETVLAEANGRPVGLMTLFGTYSTNKGRPCLCVDNLYVAPEARGGGVARRLMARACRLADERGCCRVELYVRADNPARAFYEALGMTASEDVPYTIQGRALADLAALD